mmetsp:Transcript_19364/g.39148  ORF Transcript_19364/g.39148 Transcript_19364/m.39148 type:complete len:420 (-) Transcript_19364:63-1322(-)
MAYRPPHLRRGGGGGSNNTGRNDSDSYSSTGGSGSRPLSRWSNVSTSTRDTPPSSSHQQRYSHTNSNSRSYGSDGYSRSGFQPQSSSSYSNGVSRYGESSSSSASRSRPAGGTSRWANVTDASLRAPAPGPGRRRRPGEGPPSTPPPPIKVAFFGDSFVRLFGLIERPDVMVRGFKGASAKGLGREGNENRDTIRNFVDGPTGKHLERLVFVFGSVDVHLSFYYTKYVKGQDIDLDDIAEKYVDFVADLSTADSSVKKTIVGVYFSPLADADVGPSLASYGSLTEEQAALVSGSHDAELRNRQERVLAFNNAVRKRCEERGCVQYEDINDVMTDSETYEIKDAYKDVSNHNIHIVWETTLLLWLDRWSWLKDLTPPGFSEGLQRTLETYLKTKPWAERTHVAETVGVDGAVHDKKVNQM